MSILFDFFGVLMVDSLNQVLTLITDYLLYPFQGLSKLWGLVFLSILGGVVLLLCYGKVSNQNGIRNIKRKIFASMYESVLYRHDTKLCLHAQWRMLLSGFVYFAYAVPPIIILMIPCVLMLAQMNLRYDSDGLNLNKSALITLKMDDSSALDRVNISLPSDAADVTPRLRLLSENSAVWRVTPKKQGSFDLSIEVSDPEKGISEQYKHEIVVDDAKILHLPSRKVKSWWEALLYPGTLRLPESSAISEVAIAYPSVDYRFLGLKWHWLVLFLVLSIISGLVASKVFGVAV